MLLKLPFSMTSICSEDQKFQSFHHHINIPPRKLLSRKGNPDMGSDSPRFSFSLDTLLQKFLPFNNAGSGDDDGGSDDGDPYSSDHFRMYEFKVRRCTRSRSHDWTDCPFAHPGEKARRRDPRRFHYSGTVCPEFRRGGCNRGDGCEFAHGVFECWLHPARYRTEACKDGKNCKRKICFFAHSPRQLRILPVTNSPSEIPSKNNHSIRSPGIGIGIGIGGGVGTGGGAGSNHCCMFCHCGKTSSPTSTLFNMSHSSPPHSPPLSPSMNGFSPVSSKLSGVLSYKDALTELMSSIESMNMTDDGSRMPWIDVSSLNNEDQLQFILSPSTPNFSGSRPFSSGEKIDCSNNKIAMDHGNKGNYESDLGCVSGPDLGWVNDLLM